MSISLDDIEELGPCMQQSFLGWPHQGPGAVTVFAELLPTCTLSQDPCNLRDWTYPAQVPSAGRGRRDGDRPVVCGTRRSPWAQGPPSPVTDLGVAFASHFFSGKIEL